MLLHAPAAEQAITADLAQELGHGLLRQVILLEALVQPFLRIALILPWDPVLELRPELADPMMQWAYKVLGVAVIVAVSMVASAVLH